VTEYDASVSKLLENIKNKVLMRAVNLETWWPVGPENIIKSHTTHFRGASKIFEGPAYFINIIVLVIVVYSDRI
jgi:hypothetical protein